MASTPGDAGGAYDGQALDVFAVMISADSDIIPQSLQDKGLHQDTDVTAVVGEEGSGGDDQDVVFLMNSSFFLRGSRRIAASCRLAS